MTRQLASSAALLCLFALFSSSGIASAAAAPSNRDAEVAFTKAKAEYLALKDDSKRRQFRDQWLVVVTKLEDVARKYPKSKRAPDALYNAAKLYSDLYRVSLARRDLQASLDAWESLYTRYPKSNLADDAHLERGRLFRDRQGDLGRARGEFKAAVALRGDVRGEAERELVALAPEPRRPAAAKADGKASDKSSAEDRRAKLSKGIAQATAPRSKAQPVDQDPGENTFSGQQIRAIASASRHGIPLSVQAGLKVKRIIIDAGHGGHDTGAIGKAGTREKDVVLSIALKLQAKLEEAGYDALLTRSDDTFVPLEERARFANRNKGDLFISIHCNANPDRRLRGVETYTLNVASDRYAMRLAAFENQASERAVSDLQLVLADLAKKANTGESTQFARAIHPTVVSALKEGKRPVPDLGIKQALFYVLLGVQMPSVLVEAGFLSNAQEEKLLAKPATQQKLANSMARGIIRFITERDAMASAWLQ
ncbi:MAG: N-acetylmuramoyl-L-alanine amidase [Myxococcales bacterium]|jgi:N-acetylmuramoyl-L-alanine amidase|nr:N-acetylmuramoyl-L-alanine amidase [Myxococcales bacterium]